MNCIALYHLGFEDLGAFAAPLEEAGYSIRYQHAGTPLTEAQWRDTDLIVMLGGPIGVNDTALYPWLADEIAGVRLRLQLDKPLLGICLGAQLMAHTLGGEIRARVAGKEIGWAPVEVTAEGPLAHLRGVPVLHWHGDNIHLPPQVSSAASTPGTPCQAFQSGKALGIQFHAEFAPAALEQWLTGHAVELQHAGVDLAQLRHDTQRYGDQLVQAGRALLRAWLDSLAQPAAKAVLYHDGCKVCLDIARRFAGEMPALDIVDLSLQPQLKARAEALGVVALPSLVIGGKVLPVSPHSQLADIGTEGH
ncbi:glutamine amidotransferase [Duganella callida]|uniref:Glutamine amidotransferase n=1 Tax=Duganella callida TaxID=2561932 RepID=A0A4Y9SWG6_9BURK|nr:glutamine amidotransferase [Duganella callida]TFW30935.1 glutamine amidotransferase [Duganella callida]